MSDHPLHEADVGHGVLDGGQIRSSIGGNDPSGLTRSTGLDDRRGMLVAGGAAPGSTGYQQGYSKRSAKVDQDL
jgi:hypothetical protein